MVAKKKINSEYKRKFLRALTKTFKAYNIYGARSNKKLIPIHRWIARTIKQELGKGFKVTSLGNGGEYKLEGKYYPKDLDITVIKNNKAVSAISFKFVTSNYKQNANNYFENLLGETANIRRVNVGFAHFLVLRAHTPYYDKNRGNLRGRLKKMETLNEHNLLKYVKLFSDLDFPHKPEVLGIIVVDFNRKGSCYFADLDKLKISKETKKILNQELSLDRFIEKFIALCQLKS